VRNNIIPSKDDFSRAKAAMRKNDQGLSQVRDEILAQFGNKGLHEFFIFYSLKSSEFGAYVFYCKNHDIEDAKKSGLSEDIKFSVLNELKKIRLFSMDTIKINFEFDSNENVEKNYIANYYNRLL